MRNCRGSGTETESSEDRLAKLLAILAGQVKAAMAQPQPKENAECVVSFSLPIPVVRYLDYLTEHGRQGTSRKLQRPASRSSLIAQAIAETRFTREEIFEALDHCKEKKRDQGAGLVSARISARSFQRLWDLGGDLGRGEKPLSIKAAGEALLFFWSQVHTSPKYEEVESILLSQPCAVWRKKRGKKEPASMSQGHGRTVWLVRRSPRPPANALATEIPG